ncbi:MAG: hypothetical protein MUO88_15105 [Desulfobacterales bacterium]|nr:hypothetical protein [Desulfobacterales bacterium]
MAAKTGFFHSHGAECCNVILAAEDNLAHPNLIKRIVIKISDHLKLFRTCLVNGISRVAGRKFDDVIRKVFANLFKYTAGYKAAGHGFGHEFSFANQIKHHGANRFSHILTDGKLKI